MSIIASIRSRSGRQRGFTLMTALVCLVIVGALAAEMVRSVVMARRQTRQQTYELQAAWLAEAGISRAQAQLQMTPAYKGETWEPEWMDDIRPQGKTTSQGTVEIKVEAASDGPDGWRVSVAAQYPRGAEKPMLCRREQVISLSSRGTP